MLSESRAELRYTMPLAEIIFDALYPQVAAPTKASMRAQPKRYQLRGRSQLVNPAR